MVLAVLTSYKQLAVLACLLLWMRSENTQNLVESGLFWKKL
jgi:hypothetical protein